jgi:hypothetical protein
MCMPHPVRPAENLRERFPNPAVTYPKRGQQEPRSGGRAQRDSFHMFDGACTDCERFPVNREVDVGLPQRAPEYIPHLALSWSCFTASGAQMAAN